MEDDFQADIAAVNRIEAVPTILEVVCRTTGMGFAAVARVTEDRWIACSVRDEIAFGLQPGGELKVETTICDEIRESREPVVINHVAEDDAYCGHPTPAMYGFQSYISMPIILPNGTFFGILCAIDPKPAKLKTPEIIGMFKLFAELIAFHLSAIEQLASSEANLLDARKTADLREQFIAVLGHDLRNPLTAIISATEMLEKTPLTERGERFTRLIQASADRISGLINNMLDFARGRLGGGLRVERKPEALEPVLAQVIAELRASWPEREIDAEVFLTASINCDSGRISQLLSNLLANALTYGKADSPIRVRTMTLDGALELSVANAGKPIPTSAQKQLFQPFFRAASQPGEAGLGLGLYIASEIAKAHGGTLDVASSTDETRFTFGNYIFDSLALIGDNRPQNKGLSHEQEHDFDLPAFRNDPGSGNCPAHLGRAALAERRSLSCLWPR
jgi:signal transduction histidine kinase